MLPPPLMPPMPKCSDRPLVLVVAGLDSGGGAGVTADCLSVHDNGAFALPAVTCLTAQSLRAVQGVLNTPQEFFARTLELAASDWERIAAVKVGLVGSGALLGELLDFLDRRLPGVAVVWDPVLTATAGRLDSADLRSRLGEVLRHVSILTPNLPEALELAGWTSEELGERGMAQLCRVFLDAGARSVLIKGGHQAQAEQAADHFASAEVSFTMSYPRRPGDGAHGGGCALSSALAAHLACGYALQDAAVLAKAYVTQGIYEPALAAAEARPPIGHHGLPQRLLYYPRVHEEGFPDHDYGFARTPHALGLYPVVPDVEWLERLLGLGVKTLQLRIKDPQAPQLAAHIARAVELGRRHQARIFIDDHYELAMQCGAYGVHLGMEDLRTADLQRIRASGLHLGVSTHGPYEMLKAWQLCPSYIALGHVFPTRTKAMPSSPQGVAHVALQAQLLGGKVPLVAIGGIKYEQAAALMEAGVGSIAVVTALTDIGDEAQLQQAVREWLHVVGDGGAEDGAAELPA